MKIRGGRARRAGRSSVVETVEVDRDRNGRWHAESSPGQDPAAWAGIPGREGTWAADESYGTGAAGTVPAWLTPSYELTGHVVTITYNRPEAMNAINGEMRRDLNDAFARFRDEEDAWVAIVTGAGRAFCAGADLQDGAGSTGEFPGSFWEKPTSELLRERVGDLQAGHRRGERSLPRLRAHDGDMVRLRARKRTRQLRLIPRRAIGIPAIVGAIRLPQRIGWADAMEMLMTGEPVDATQGERDRTRVAGRGPRRAAGRSPRARRPARPRRAARTDAP